MPWGNTWYQPLLFYIVSMVLMVAPLSEFAVRLPVAIVGGVLTPILMYLVALRLFKRRGLALFSAVVLALTPPQLILSRQALDYVCPLPFILGWFWFLIDYTETRRTRSAVLGALCLGFGFYSYIASWVLMPIYFGLSAIVYWRVRCDRNRAQDLARSLAQGGRCGRWWRRRLDSLRRWCSSFRGSGRTRRCCARPSIATRCRTRNRCR